MSLPKLKLTVEPNDINFVNFVAIFHATLEKHAPLKERFVNVNQPCFMDKK